MTMAIEDKVERAKEQLSKVETNKDSGHMAAANQHGKTFRKAVAAVLNDPDFNTWVNADKRHLTLLEQWANSGNPPHKGQSARQLQKVVDGVKATQLATAKAAAALREQKVHKTMNKLFK